jgi:hypothetical protein
MTDLRALEMWIDARNRARWRCYTEAAIRLALIAIHDNRKIKVFA